jgi:molybdopterin synthase sulfur carrier subunit
MAAVRIPPTLRAEVGGVRELAAEGATVGEVLDDLVERYPPLGPQLLEDGKLAPFVNVYVGGEDVRTRDGLDTRVGEREQLILLPALAGGAHGVRPRGF